MGTMVQGSDLRIGQVVKVWFTGEQGSTLVGLRPYKGPLEYLFPKGAQIGNFTSNTPKGRTEMTIDNGDVFEVLSDVIVQDDLDKLRTVFVKNPREDHAQGLGDLNHYSYLGERSVTVVPILLDEIAALRQKVAALEAPAA